MGKLDYPKVLQVLLQIQQRRRKWHCCFASVCIHAFVDNYWKHYNIPKGKRRRNGGLIHLYHCLHCRFWAQLVGMDGRSRRGIKKGGGRIKTPKPRTSHKHCAHSTTRVLLAEPNSPPDMIQWAIVFLYIKTRNSKLKTFIL